MVSSFSFMSALSRVTLAATAMLSVSTDVAGSRPAAPVATALIFPMFLFCTTTGIAQNTSMFRNDPAHSGIYAGGLPQLHRVKWKFHTAGEGVSSPAVGNGVGCGCGRVVLRGVRGNFYAIDPVSGKLRWKFSNPGERRYAATHLHGSLPAGETMPDPFDVYLSSPTVWNGVVSFGR